MKFIKIEPNSNSVTEIQMKMKNSADRFNNKLLDLKREQWTGRKVRRKYVKIQQWKIQERDET